MKEQDEKMVKKWSDEYVLINGISQYFLHLNGKSDSVVLMLHGGPGAPNSYIAYYHQRFWANQSVVYYDQRGAGKTQLKNRSQPESLSLEILLEDLHQTIRYVKEKYQTERIVLLGHSWGSQLGTEYVLKYPKDIVAFIGYGQVVDMHHQERSWYEFLKKTVAQKGKKREQKRLLAIHPDFPDIPKEDYFRAVNFLMKMEHKYGYKATSFLKIFLKSPLMGLKDEIQMLKTNQTNKQLYLDALYKYDLTQVKKYELPIFYLLGEYDEWMKSSIVASYFESITAPQKGLYWIKNAGHMIDTDNPVDFFARVREILKEL